jgi:hypothetical protein
MKILLTILITIVIILIFVSVLIATSEGLKRHEKVECLEWQRQAEEYPLFWSADWQKEQCLNYSIILEK